LFLFFSFSCLLLLLKKISFGMHFGHTFRIGMFCSVEQEKEDVLGRDGFSVVWPATSLVLLASLINCFRRALHVIAGGSMKSSLKVFSSQLKDAVE